ncbi:MAG: ATP-binding protein [Candidatus Obscuribacterales bacterium]|nr:ATP-binding protein [Candidatus Obscuribacterales bacterium]
MINNLAHESTLEVINVLLVEDNAADAYLIQELLPSEVYKLTHAPSLSKAHLAAKIDHFDIVLLDLSLEDGFGLDTFLAMHTSLPQTPICILTGNDNDEIALEAIKFGAQDYVAKHALSERGLARIIRYSIQRHQAQSMIIESDRRAITAETHLKLALRASKIGIWSYSIDEGRVYFDEQMLALFGVIPGTTVETIPQFLQYVHIDDRKRILEAFEKSIELKNDYNSEYKIVWPDGSEHYIAARGQIISDIHGQSTLVAGVCTDITKQKLEHKNALRLIVLEQHEDFIATLTHDLKNPLIGADKALELFLCGALGTLDDRQLKLLTLMRESNADMLALIQNLLEVYRYDEGQPSLSYSQVNIASLATACIRQLNGVAEESSIQFHENFPHDQCEISVDSIAIGRVLRNLISNAMKFTRAGGKISISGNDTGDFYTLTVEDTGAGIPEEDQNLLFQRFSQGKLGKKYAAGTGLGLYLCRQLVEAHGGRIACTSKVGVGTLFTVTLPKNKEQNVANSLCTAS